MLSRRELLKRSGAVAGPALLAGRVPQSAAAPRATRSMAGMNIVLFVTDQDRAIQHFPRDWAKRNLPGLTRLQQHGLTFENAFCNACMCSPSRATLMTGYYPAQHGVKFTLEEDMPAEQFPQVELPLDFKNIASVMAAAGYHVVYKGKWHISKPAGDEFAPSDLEAYGFSRWNPPDGGANQDISEEGGGVTNHDGRFMDGTGDAAEGLEGVQQYLKTQAAQQEPFFLVVSLVNPHDVLLYPKKYKQGGYDDAWLEGEIGLPETVDEDLSDKPSAHQRFLRIFNLSGLLPTPQMKRAYLNFYGNLLKSADAYLVALLDTLTSQQLLDDTVVIRTADHGEMGMAHGGMRQKNFNCYEETLRVPLVYSNPRLWKKPQTSQAMVSHVDFVPTLASLVEAPTTARTDWAGVDYSAHVLDKSSAPAQDHIIFTYDDFQAGQNGGPYVPPPQHIVSLREQRWKFAEYFDAAGTVPSQWEMYDLKSDPLEKKNLAARGYRRTTAQQKQYRRLRRKLSKIKAQRLQPLPNTPTSPLDPSAS